MYIENNLTRTQLSNWLILMFILVSLMIIIGGLTRLTDLDYQLQSGNYSQVHFLH